MGLEVCMGREVGQVEMKLVQAMTDSRATLSQELKAARLLVSELQRVVGRLESQLVRERRGAERKREALREEVAELRAALVVARDAVAAGAA